MKTMIQMVPSMPVRSNEERRQLRPVGRNVERYAEIIDGMVDIVKAADALGYCDRPMPGAVATRAGEGGGPRPLDRAGHRAGRRGGRQRDAVPRTGAPRRPRTMRPVLRGGHAVHDHRGPVRPVALCSTGDIVRAGCRWPTSTMTVSPRARVPAFSQAQLPTETGAGANRIQTAAVSTDHAARDARNRDHVDMSFLPAAISAA